MLGAIDTRAAFRIPIHDMDHVGTVQGLVSADFGGQRHNMALKTWHEDCGVDFKSVECSCGMHQLVRYGSGCWQHGHNGPMPDRLTLDAEHQELYDFAQSEVQAPTNDRTWADDPAHWGGPTTD
jgi:hypothetical protein